MKTESISPGRGVVSETTHVTITGKNLASGASILAGSGITASNMNVTPEEITADLAIAHNAAGGNRSVKVKVNGKHTNSKDFYVQILTKLVPLHNATVAPNGIGPLKTPVNSPLKTMLLKGSVFRTSMCILCRSII